MYEPLSSIIRTIIKSMSVYYLCIICLLVLSQTQATSLGRRYDSPESDSKNQRTVMMNINGEDVPVVLPGEDIPSNLPQTISTKEHDGIIDNSLVILPQPSSVLRNDPQSPADGPPSSTPPSNTSQAAPTTQPSPTSTPSNSSAPHIEPPPHNPNNNGTESAVTTTTTTTTTHATTHLPEPPATTTPHTPPAPPPTSRPSQPTSIFIMTGFPMYVFGPIYPIYTQHPMVFQYVTSPIVYYMQVINIVHSIVPNDVIPLNSVMELSLAITNLMRSSAENLESVVVDEPDGPNIAPEVEVSGDMGFRSALTGEVNLDIPTPVDVTNEIQNAVQSYAEAAPEDIQNELIQALSKNMADLLKPLYQNIVYTRKLRMEDSYQQVSPEDSDTTQRIYRRQLALARRNPQDVVIAGVPAVNETAGNTTAGNATAGNVTVPTITGIITTTTPSPIPNVAAAAAALVSSLGLTTTPRVPSALGAVAVSNPSGLGAVAVSNPSGSYSLSATSAPANPFTNPLSTTINPATAGVDLINSLLNSATSPFSSLFSLIPNPFKIVYTIMNTIATVYPKIQLSVLVGLSTCITQIVARVLEIIASFVGIFAALGRKRRDLSSADPVSTLNMDQVLNDLHKDIKEAVHTYLPEAPPSVKKELTSALYTNSLDAINDAVGPMQEQMNKKREELQETLPSQVEIPQSAPLNDNLRMKTDVFGNPDQDVLRVNSNNDFAMNVPGGGDVFGNQNNFGKQVDQLATDLGQATQDVFALPNFDPAQQNYPQTNNQNGFWNKK